MKLNLINLFVFVVSLNAFNQSKLDSAFLEFRRDKSLLNANISFQVIDLDKDTIFQAYNDSVSLPAASTALTDNLCLPSVRLELGVNVQAPLVTAANPSSELPS